MAGIYSPKNVGKLIFGGALSAETTSKTFRASADVGEIQIISADGTAAAAGKDFKVFAKDNSGTTGVNVSDKIEVDKVNKVVVKKYAAPVQKSVDVTGFTGTPKANATYRVSIRKYDHIQSPENFRHIHGFAVTGTDPGTYTAIMNEIKANLESALLRENSISDFNIVVGADKITITANPTEYVQGKIQGDQIQFDVEVSVKENSPATLNTDAYANVLSVVVVQEANPGQGTYKGVANLEYFLNGYETADYGREVGYPANFNFSPKAISSGIYNTVQLSFYSERETVNVERQPKELTIVFEESAGVTKVELVNAFLAVLRTVLGAGNVPADLA